MQGHLEVQTVPKRPTVGLGIHKDPCLQWPNPSFSRTRGTRTIPYAEYVKRRDEGRCYHYGNTFGPGHRCPKKTMRVLILAEHE